MEMKTAVDSPYQGATNTKTRRHNADTGSATEKCHASTPIRTPQGETVVRQRLYGLSKAKIQSCGADTASATPKCSALTPIRRQKTRYGFRRCLTASAAVTLEIAGLISVGQVGVSARGNCLAVARLRGGCHPTIAEHAVAGDSANDIDADAIDRVDERAAAGQRFLD